MRAIEELAVAALAALEAEAVARDTAALVQVPSITGDEGVVLERLAEIASGYGLTVDLHEHDLEALRAAPGYPGERAPRDRIFGLTVSLPGTDGDAARLCLNGHVDVVTPGPLPWRLDPWSGAIDGGRIHGRGSVDMKGGVVAALHAMAALKKAGGAGRGEIVLQAVASEEDGGLGTFAALERDGTFSACLIPEPTGLRVACAHAGAFQFEGTVYGRSAHAACRLEGISAIDRYILIHQALHAHERRINESVEHELMRLLELPYPISVGRIEGGEWPSQVPDRLTFQGRVAVCIGESVEEARAALRKELSAAVDGGPDVFELAWVGGRFTPGETPADHPFVTLAREALSRELVRPAELAGVPYGADMCHFCARGIPCLMVGTSGLERAHAVDEYVEVDELVHVARAIVRVLTRFWAVPGAAMSIPAHLELSRRRRRAAVSGGLTRKHGEEGE